MTSVDTEIARLSHKDVRIRRRAVRTLFDLNSHCSLKEFIPLLDDSDPWFRTKAIDAHRNGQIAKVTCKHYQNEMT